MILTLMTQRVIQRQYLPEKVQGQFWLTIVDLNNTSKQIMGIEAAGTVWKIKSNSTAHLCGIKDEVLYECILSTSSVYKILITSTGEYAYLFCEESTADRRQYSKYILPTKGTLKIGRAENNDIIFKSKFLSMLHTEIVFDSSNYTIKDCGSSNGTFVNGERISQKKLLPGDTIFLMGLKIIMGKGYIAINNPDQNVSINTHLLISYKNQEIIDRTPSFDKKNYITKFFRSPRLKRDINTYDISIDPPPQSPIMEQLPLLLTIGPSATMGLASLTMAITSIINLVNGNTQLLSALPMLVMAFAMMCGTLVWPSIIKNYEKKRRQGKEEVRQKKYVAYLDSIQCEIKNEEKKQYEILCENYIPIDNCLQRIKNIQRNLWEKTSSNSDFLVLRLGRGSVPLDCDIKCQKRRFSLEEDKLLEMQYDLAEKSHMIQNAPVTISIRDSAIAGIIGSKKETNSLAKSFIFQIAALHSYDEVKIIIICNENDRTWDFVKWLPHVWSDDRNIRFIAKNQQQVHELSIFLERELSVRVNSRQYDNTAIPHYVVFAFDQTLAEQADFMKQIYRNRTYYGFSVLAFYNEFKMLPKECARIIELSSMKGRIYGRDSASGDFIEFIPELFNGNNEEEYASILSNIVLDNTSEQYSMPSNVTFLQAYDVGHIEYLNISSRWKENDPTLSLEVIIGLDEYGDKFLFDIHERAYGPHGLIAGTTGSGKSEFIMTYILALAINFHPSEVAFILIDYKGGGMAKAFEHLPHTAGIITNLDGNEVNRSLVSIKSELRRRQALFNEASKLTGISNIDIYKYQRMYRDGVVSHPLPHLIIISDEFAELKSQQPEFMTELVSTARIGRSLGVHLILATQKPTGVVDDQIVSNSKFRICLKVQDRQDSMEMLKRPEASEIKTTGRFYLQIGNNEIFKLGQSAWSGAKYIPSDNVQAQNDNSIEIITNTGRVSKQIRLKPSQSGNSMSQLDAITRYVTSIAAQENFKQRMLWCPSMPSIVALADIEKKYNYKCDYKIAPIIGEFDVPEQQKQEPMVLDFESVGNTVVYGASGSGKNTFVTTLIYSIITHYSADMVNIYALDFAAQTLSVFSKAPQVGEVILPEDEEKISNLFKMLNSELNKRKVILREYGGDYSTYRQESDQKLPCIVVVIHNYTGLTENYDVDDAIALLTREGAKRGIYFVVTAQSAGALRHKTLQNFSQLLVLRMNDPLDYASILGNTGGMLPASYLGRGIFKTDSVYEFQVARSTIDNQLKNIREICNSLASAWKGQSAQNVPVLPKKVDSNFLARSWNRSSDSIPVGVDMEKHSVVCYPVLSNPLSWVLSESGRNNLFAQGLAETISMKDDIRINVIDPMDNFIPQGGSTYSYFSSTEEMNKAILSFFDGMLERHNALKSDPEKCFERCVFIITSMSMLEPILTDDNKTKFFDALNNINSKYGIYCVICESGDYIKKSAAKDWVKKHTTFRDAVWIGDGLFNNFRLQVEKTSKKTKNKMDSHSGYILTDGTAIAARLLVPNELEIEEE